MSSVIVMRKDAVYTVLLNATLFTGMKCSYAPQDQRYLRFSTFDRAGVPTHYNLRVSGCPLLRALPSDRSALIGVCVRITQLANARIAGELLDEINTHIP